MRNPQVVNGTVVRLGERAGIKNKNIVLRCVEIEKADGSGREIFEILDMNHTKYEQSTFVDPWNQIHQAEVGEFVTVIHGDANRNDKGRKLFIGYAVAR